MEIEKWLLDEHQLMAVVLLGMGGSGKTQLALECCRKAEITSSFAAVIWIDTSLLVTVVQSYNIIASKVTKRSQKILDIAESMAIVEDVLQQWKKKWLVVFNNFDNFKEFQEHNIQGYVPKVANGKILFTNRHAGLE